MKDNITLIKLYKKKDNNKIIWLNKNYKIKILIINKKLIKFKIKIKI